MILSTFQVSFGYLHIFFEKKIYSGTLPILKLDNDDFAIQLYEFLIFFWYWPLIRVHLQCRGPQFNSWVGKIRCRGERLRTPVFWGFPSGSAGKESVCNAGDLGLILGLGRSPGEGKGYLLQYSGLENSMDCVVHGVAKSQTWLRDFHFHFFSHAACKYFLSFSRLPFHFVDFFSPLSVQKQFDVTLLIHFCLGAFEVIFKIWFPRPMSRSFTHLFSSRSFMVSGLTFNFWVHFELIFVHTYPFIPPSLGGLTTSWY